MATLVKGIGKLGIAIGAVAATASLGIWSGDTRKSEAALQRVKSSVPSAEQYIQKIPNPSAVGRDLSNQWNSGIQTVFHWVMDVPQKTCQAVKDALGSGDK
ncbi:uncharacterized protein LOC128224464 [Mya arenaria]|uniref:uncharacterized protein LOC128224464 n=1 Tax=Mya arenaria TaxID=6604 RepID=UPI0022E6F710|nr:uncharacterized protein LOC128224464 [Mya arenaria]